VTKTFVSLEAQRALDSIDQRALASVGIILGAPTPLLPARKVPTKPTLKAVMKDRLRLTHEAANALRESRRTVQRGWDLTSQQVLLALLDLQPPDPARALFEALGVDAAQVRQRLSPPPNAA